ncbi:alpha/beta fold hydrolase [Phenylobacterium immobile]|uniref:alpha/beta fold hydrolase n=1 Tax=Phenylobacterium immobile TaxID=21 RepID=UPI000A847EFC|nr:alpha/beta hydrolase [Phenylobacterium immobile]
MASITEESTARDVRTRKWKLHYNEAGSGYPVIMIHGSGPGATGWNNFAPNIQGLAGKYRVIAIDLPGWGGSDEMDPTIENRNLANAEAVKLLMDELGLAKACLVGNSAGGVDTLHFAASYPDRLSHMVTTGSPVPTGAPNMFTPAGPPEAVRHLRATYADPTPENFRKMTTAMAFSPDFASDAFCAERSVSARRNPTHLTNFLKGFPHGKAGMPPAELIARLSAFKGPALVMHGRDDRAVSMENTLRLVGVISDSSAHIFNRCGHWSQLEHPAWFNGLVDAFLQSRGVTPAIAAPA